MYEKKHQPLAPARLYYKRIAWNFLFTLIVVTMTMAIGTSGFYLTRDTQCPHPITLLDAFHNSAMLLSGMGPILECYTPTGKWFSSFFALFSGIVFITNLSVLLAPGVHRIFHKLHLEDK